VTSEDSTITSRRAQYFHSFPTKIDVQYFGDTLPATAYVGSDVPSIIAAVPAPFIAALSGTVTGLTTGTIAATPSPFTVAAAGNAGVQGAVAATPAPFTMVATGSSVGPGVSGTIGANAAAFVAALTGNAGNQGTLASTPAPFVAALAGTNTQPPTTGTIVAIPGLAVVAAAGSTTSYSTGTVAVIAGTVVTNLSGGFFSNSSGTINAQPGAVVVAIVGRSGALITYGTVTLTSEQVTTITLSDAQVTTITLTITDEEGVAMNSFMLGNVVRLNALVKDINLALTDAATVTVSTKPTGGVATPVTPTRLSTGAYRYDCKPAIGGTTYAVRVETLNPDAATEEQFYILPSQFP
jgi:hypothetical protein